MGQAGINAKEATSATQGHELLPSVDRAGALCFPHVIVLAVIQALGLWELDEAT